MYKEKSSKIVADNLFRISISSLKLNKFLKTGVSGIINIPYTSGVFKDGVHLVVSFQNKVDPHLYFYYSILQPDGSYRAVEYRVNLETTKCNYGGVRHWFKCPIEILGCDRRVGMLYKVGDYFACRSCFDLTYRSRNKRGPYGLGVIDIGLVITANDPRNWKYYRGKPTRRFMRALKMNEKFEKSLAIFNARGDDRVKKTLEKLEPFMQKEKNLRKKNKGVG